METQADIIAQLWDLAEGVCTQAQAERLHKRIAQDEAIEAVWREITESQQMLTAWEPAQPSMRFQQSVLERLPQIKRKEELVPTWVGWLLTTGFVLAFIPTFYDLFELDPERVSYESGVLDILVPEMNLSFLDWKYYLSHFNAWPILWYMAICGVGLSLLLAVDRYYFKARVQA